MDLADFQTWKDVASALRNSVPFVTEALNVLPLVETTRVPFAGTDGKSVMVNPGAWAAVQEDLLTKGEWYPTDQGAAAAVLLHECLHTILRHQKRGQFVDRRDQWAQAVDIFTNNVVVDIFTLPPFQYHGEKMEQFKKALHASGTFDERFRGKDTEEIYNTLCAENPEQPPQDNPPDQPDKPCNGGQGGSGAPEPDSGGDGPPQDQQGQNDPSEDDGGVGNGGGGTAPQDKPLDNDLMEDGMSGVPDDVGELIDNSMDDYMERNASFAPSGSGLAREIQEVKRKPPVPMSQVLRKIRDVIAGSVYSYRRPSRQDAFNPIFGIEARMPSFQPDPSDKVRKLVIALDYSGSMGQKEREAAFSLVRDAFKHVKREILLLCFTDHIVQAEVITPTTKLVTNFSGGTKISSVLDYLEENRVQPSAVVLVTDTLDEPSKLLFARWRYLNRLRTIVVGNPNGNFPGLVFHATEIDGFPRR